MCGRTIRNYTNPKTSVHAGHTLLRFGKVFMDTNYTLNPAAQPINFLTYVAQLNGKYHASQQYGTNGQEGLLKRQQKSTKQKSYFLCQIFLQVYIVN